MALVQNYKPVKEFLESITSSSCKYQIALKKMLEKVFKEDLTFEEERCDKYLSLAKYLGYELYPWEEFFIALHLCLYKDGEPRFPDGFCMMGRGNGKDGIISLEAMALASPYNPVPDYDVDICANNEEQAMRPVSDLISKFDTQRRVLNRHFKWTKEKIVGIKNRGTIKGYADNPKGRDGMRSGVVIFNEYHQYENSKNVEVFTTGLGKKPEPRRTIYTTQGNVVEGPLDELLKRSEQILFEGEEDDGLLPFIFMIDKKEEVDDEANWVKANPSLPFKPELLKELRKEYKEWKRNPATHSSFMTKRMNYRQSDNEYPVAKWSEIEATNKPVPDLKGCECVVGIDFSKTTDWASINLHFKQGDKRYDINHAWVCMQGDIERLRCPFKDWASMGLVSLVYAPEISPKIMADYIKEMSLIYNIKKVAIDSYRYTLMMDYLKEVGYSTELKNLSLTRPSDIMKAYPLIDRCFANGFFNWGDQPVLRWSTNNCKLIPAKSSVLSANGIADTGNFLIGKIEPKSRKTDPFMALVHSMTIEKDLLGSYVSKRRIQVYTY